MNNTQEKSMTFSNQMGGHSTRDVWTKVFHNSGRSTFSRWVGMCCLFCVSGVGYYWQFGNRIPPKCMLQLAVIVFFRMFSCIWNLQSDAPFWALSFPYWMLSFVFKRIADVVTVIRKILSETGPCLLGLSGLRDNLLAAILSPAGLLES